MSTADLSKQKAAADFNWTNDDENDSDDFDSCFPPAGQRLAPVGANADDDAAVMKELKLGGGGGDSCEPAMPESAASTAQLELRLQELEDEQEELNSSLLAMTSHFAKVRK